MGAAAATETKGKVEEVWLAMVDNVFEVGEASVHGELEDLGDSIYDSPDFDELEELTTMPINPGFSTIDGAYTSTFCADELASSAEIRNVEVDLYDSGASC